MDNLGTELRQSCKDFVSKKFWKISRRKILAEEISKKHLWKNDGEETYGEHLANLMARIYGSRGLFIEANSPNFPVSNKPSREEYQLEENAPSELEDNFLFFSDLRRFSHQKVEEKFPEIRNSLFKSIVLSSLNSRASFPNVKEEWKSSENSPESSKKDVEADDTKSFLNFKINIAMLQLMVEISNKIPPTDLSSKNNFNSLSCFYSECQTSECIWRGSSSLFQDLRRLFQKIACLVSTKRFHGFEALPFVDTKCAFRETDSWWKIEAECEPDNQEGQQEDEKNITEISENTTNLEIKDTPSNPETMRIVLNTILKDSCLVSLATHRTAFQQTRV